MVLGVGRGSGVLCAENRLRYDREVGDRSSMVSLNFCGYLGGQTGKTVRTTHFLAKSVCYSTRFWGWAGGVGVL